MKDWEDLILECSEILSIAFDYRIEETSSQTEYPTTGKESATTAYRDLSSAINILKTLWAFDYIYEERKPSSVNTNEFFNMSVLAKAIKDSLYRIIENDPRISKYTEEIEDWNEEKLSQMVVTDSEEIMEFKKQLFKKQKHAS